MTNEEILKNKIKEKFGDTELINKYVYEQCIIAGVLEAMDEAKNLHKSLVSNLLLERAMIALDDYLNAGCKETRKKASENAKIIYREYYGVDYVNRNDR